MKSTVAFALSVATLGILLIIAGLLSRIKASQVGAGPPQQETEAILPTRATALPATLIKTVGCPVSIVSCSNPGSGADTFDVYFTLNCTGSSAGTVTGFVRYTDSSNVQRDKQVTSADCNVVWINSGNGDHLFFKARQGTQILIFTTITGSVSYDASGAIFKISNNN